MWLPARQAKTIDSIADQDEAVQRVLSEKVSVAWSRVQEWLALDHIPPLPARSVTKRNWKVDEVCTAVARESRLVVPTVAPQEGPPPSLSEADAHPSTVFLHSD